MVIYSVQHSKGMIELEMINLQYRNMHNTQIVYLSEEDTVNNAKTSRLDLGKNL